MWYTRHIHNSQEMHPLQYCPMSWIYKLEGDPSQIEQLNLNQPVDLTKHRRFKKDIQIQEKNTHRKCYSKI